MARRFSCRYCSGNDEEPQDHCMDCERPRSDVTPVMREALKHVASGKSMRGLFSSSTYWALRRKNLIEDSDTITDAGRAVVAQRDGES